MDCRLVHAKPLSELMVENQENAFANVYKMAVVFLSLNVLMNSTYIHKRIMSLSLKYEINSHKITVSDILLQKLYFIT